jgi:dTDP-4-dehydrorhamnose reductase
MSQKIKILILGSKGMLGRCVHKFFSLNDLYDVDTLDVFSPFRGQLDLKDLLSPRIKGQNFIINCIGAIPQKTSDFKINHELPAILCDLADAYGFTLIQPSTDCEFSGTLDRRQEYSPYFKSDCTDEYGKSKALGTKMVLENPRGVVIRTSIIGVTPGFSGAGLLDWYLNTKDPVDGYTDHYWNGITILEWARVASEIISRLNGLSGLYQVKGQSVTKYDILKTAKDVFGRGGEIVAKASGDPRNRRLSSNFTYLANYPDLRGQMIDLKKFSE